MSAQASHPNFPQGLDIKPFVFVNGSEGNFNTEAQNRAIQRFGIAGRIWEAAELMTRYFDMSESSDWQLDPPCSMVRREDDRELTMVELGSGTGYVGLKLAEKILSTRKRRKDLVVLTDLPDVCALLEETLHDERQRWMASHLMDADIFPVKILPLPWGDISGACRLSDSLCSEKNSNGEPRILTHLICSDLVYFPHLLAPLLRTLLQLTSPPFINSDQSPEIVISYKIRSLSKETSFWSAFGLWFTFTPVLARQETNRTIQEARIGSEKDAEQRNDWDKFGSDDFIFIARRRQESVDWIVPDSDSDLLDGIGARNSKTPQSDDTFESLLMMQIGA